MCIYRLHNKLVTVPHFPMPLTPDSFAVYRFKAKFLLRFLFACPFSIYEKLCVISVSFNPYAEGLWEIGVFWSVLATGSGTQSWFLTLSTLLLKWTLLSLNLGMITIAKRVSFKTQEQNGKTCRSRWDGSLWAVSPGSTLFAKIYILVYIAERVNAK